MVSSYCHERKLAKHVKGVREKKTSINKKRTFHRVSHSITSTLTFILCTTLFPITRSTWNEKYKRGRRRTTNLNYPKNYIHGKETTFKLSSQLFSPELWKSQGIYRQKGAPARAYRAVHQISMCGSTVRPRKHGQGCVSTAVLVPRARPLLPRTVGLSPGRLYLLYSGYGHPVLTDPPFKVNGYMCRP